MRVTFCARDLVERCLLRLANRDIVQAQPQGAPRKWRESRYAADLQNSKPCRLRAPATICTGMQRSPDSGDLFVCWGTVNIQARLPLGAIRSWPLPGINTIESISPRSISEASRRVSSR